MRLKAIMYVKIGCGWFVVVVDMVIKRVVIRRYGETGTNFWKMC